MGKQNFIIGMTFKTAPRPVVFWTNESVDSHSLFLLPRHSLAARRNESNSISGWPFLIRDSFFRSISSENKTHRSTTCSIEHLNSRWYLWWNGALQFSVFFFFGAQLLTKNINWSFTLSEVNELSSWKLFFSSFWQLSNAEEEKVINRDVHKRRRRRIFLSCTHVETIDVSLHWCLTIDYEDKNRDVFIVNYRSNRSLIWEYLRSASGTE